MGKIFPYTKHMFIVEWLRNKDLHSKMLSKKVNHDTEES